MKFSFDIHYSLFDILRFKKVLNPDLKLRYKVGIGRKPVGIYAEFFPIRLNETGGFRPSLFIITLLIIYYLLRTLSLIRLIWPRPIPFTSHPSSKYRRII